MKRFMYFLIALISVSGISQNNQLFDQGKEAYKNENYAQAIENWKKILETNEASANLYFNLANAHYKLNQIGPSVYYYEKALQLNPTDRDIKNNLKFAENARIDVIDPLPKSLFKQWYDSLAGFLGYNQWAVVAVVASFLMAALFLIYYFSGKERQKRLYFASGSVALIVLLLAITMAFLTYNENMKSREAIIFASRVDIKSEPRMGSSTTFSLHEGTKVGITAQDGDWFRIHLADGKDGWISKENLKAL